MYPLLFKSTKYAMKYAKSISFLFHTLNKLKLLLAFKSEKN